MPVARYKQMEVPADLPVPKNGNSNGDIAGALAQFGQQFAANFDAGQIQRDKAQIGATIAAGGDFAPTMGMTELGRARNEIATQAYAARAELETRAHVATLQAEFNGDRITDPENAAARFDAYMGPKLAGMDDLYRPHAEDTVRRLREEFIGGLTVAAANKQHKREIDDIAAGIDMNVADALKYAHDGNDAGLVDIGTQVVAKYHGLVTSGNMGEVEAQSHLRAYADKVLGEKLLGRFVRGEAGAPTMEEAIGGTGKMAELSLETREAVTHAMSAELGRRNTVQAHAEASLRKATAQNDRLLGEAVKLVDHGGVVQDPQMGAALHAIVTGRAPASPDKVAEAKAALATQDISQRAATMREDDIAATRTEWALHPTGSYEEALVRQVYEDRWSKRAAALDKDAAEYGARVGVLPPVPMPTNPADPNFATDLDAALAAKADNSALIRELWSREASPFTKDEARALASAYTNLDSNGQMMVLGKLVSAFGPDSHLVLEDLDKNGAKALAHAGWAMTNGDPTTAEAIVRGSAAIRAGVAKVGDSGNTPAVRSAAIASSRIALVAPPEAQAAIFAAADAYAVDTFTRTGQTLNYGEAINAVLGSGGTATYRRAAVLLPHGVQDVGQFTERVQSVSPAELEQMGLPKSLEPGRIAEKIAANEADLITAGPGQYKVQIGNKIVALPNGKPFLLDFSKIEAKAATPNPYPVVNWAAVHGLASDVGNIADLAYTGLKNNTPVRDLFLTAQAAADATRRTLDSDPSNDPLFAHPKGN